ncbi:MAG TPA: replicative DNA helicase [Phycisphaerae bacterium]|nr:replicative DNA helicase [Phycisphaerae bacterium]HRY67000.1 replicative DNA helicase [Phycisphaerae bacterium]HSA28839.1 replicative DNA helicase [Phycisphaerae bacterium]
MLTPSKPTSEPPPSQGGLTRVPPQDIEAEMALLGSMMLDREVIGDVTGLIHRNEAEYFYRPDHREIFKALMCLYEEGKPVDLVTVRDELIRIGRLNEVGGVDYLVQLAEAVPNYLHAGNYAGIVRDKAMLRGLIGAAERIRDTAYDAREDAKEILDTAEKVLFEVTDKRISVQAEQLGEYLGQIFRQLESSDGHYITGVPSGFLELDDLLSGLQRGEMIIVAARPSMGKTAFGLSMAEHIAANENIPVGFFSMEMSKLAIAQRLLCMRAEVNAQHLRRNMVSEADISKLQAASEVLASMPMFVDDTPGMSVLELRAKTRRLYQRHKIQIIFIDYLQLMRSPGRVESRQVEVADISRGLKALARELNIPVVVMAQLNRNPEGRTGNRPALSDLRESGAIEQDADVVILLHREEYYYRTRGEIPPDEVRGQAEVVVAKQRNGPTDTVKVQFSPELARFRPLSAGPEPAYIPAGRYEPSGPPGDESAPF